MSKIRFIKEDDTEWFAYNTETGDTATIYKIHEYNALFDVKPRYRVDVMGKTVATMIDNFQTAKSIAYKKVKGE